MSLIEEDGRHDTALFAVSVYLTKRSNYPIRYYFTTLNSARDAAVQAMKGGWAHRILVVQRTTPLDPWQTVPRYDPGQQER